MLIKLMLIAQKALLLICFIPSIYAMELVPREMHKYIASYVMQADNEQALTNFDKNGFKDPHDESSWSLNRAWSEIGYMQMNPINGYNSTLSLAETMALSPLQRHVTRKIINDKSITEHLLADVWLYADECCVIHNLPDYVFKCIIKPTEALNVYQYATLGKWQVLGDCITLTNSVLQCNAYAVYNLINYYMIMVVSEKRGSYYRSIYRDYNSDRIEFKYLE